MRRKILSTNISINNREFDDLEINGIINLRITCHKTNLNDLECYTFKNTQEIMKKLYNFSQIEESVIIQTCNRVEIYIYTLEKNLEKISKEIESFWIRNNKINEKDFILKLEKAYNSEALFHLFRLTAGIDSIIIGEDQILGQVKKSFKEAKKCATTGKLFNKIFPSCIKTGKKIRQKTNINNGSISFGSIVLELLEKNVGSLNNKEIIIIGAGQVGSLVGKFLASLNHKVIFVSNRTYDRGVRLARELGGYAIKFDDIAAILPQVDIAIVATSAPHYVLKKDMIRDIAEKRANRKLYIIDLGQPKNVDEEISYLENVKLINLEEVNKIAKTNLNQRKREIKRSETIINEDYKRLLNVLKGFHAEIIISELYNNIEKIRNEEVKKAYKMLGRLPEYQLNIINDLTQVLMKRILHNPIKNLRKAVLNDDSSTIIIAQKLFERQL